jgi:poly [ADP-ribose] polymerase 2/3/4
MTTTIVERVELVKTSVRDNSNKFYEIALHANGDVVSRWGRVGAQGESQTHVGGGTVKLRQLEQAKIRRGYQRLDNGSARTSATPGGAVVHAAAQSALSDGTGETDELIARLAQVNRHAIELASGGMITATAAHGVQTALGPVSAATVAEARTVLASVGAGDLNAIDRYLMLVPQAMPRRAGWHSQFADPAFLAGQRDFLDQLDAAVAISPVTGVTADFRYRLAVLSVGHEDVDRLRGRFELTRNRHHGDVAGLRMLRVWELTDTTGAAGWSRARERVGGQTRQLWHGTVPANVLSILHRGLYVPPTSGSSVQITGRMFGPGVYLSDQSSKSLRYSYGSWSGTRQERCYMLAADVAMGRELRTGPGDNRAEVLRRMRQGDGTDSRRYDSLFVAAGTCGVINNEMIVPDSAQILLRHLCEFG